MRLKIFPVIGLTAVVALGMISAWSQEAPALKSVTVDLPTGDRMFTGAGADAVNNNCLACHSAGMVLNQPALTRAAWQAEVHKMITVYKAPIDDADVPAILAYLVRIDGN